MTKFSHDNKALRAIMAGTIAFTPVLAIGINAEKASAANEDVAYAKFIKELYNTPALTANRNVLTIAHTELLEVLTNNEGALVKSMLDDSIASDSPKETAAVALVTSLFNTFSPTNVDDNFDEKFQSFKDNNKSNVELLFGSNIDEEELGTFAKNVHLAYYDIIKSLNAGADTEVYIGAYGLALASFPNDKVYIALKSILKNETTVIDTLKTANTGDLNAALKNALPILVEALKQVTAPVNPPVIPGPTPIPPVDVIGEEVSTGSSTIETNPQAVIDAINKAASVEQLVVKLDAGVEVVNIPATILTALKNKNGEAVVVIVSGNASYEVPVSQIDLLAAATSLGVASAELELVVTVDEVANPLAGKAGFKTLSAAIDFKLSLVAPDGDSIELKNFSKPVQRSISTSTNLNPLTTVGVVVNANGTVVAVPTFVEGNMKSANLFRNSNSLYTLIENFKTFTDVNNGKNWSEEYVEKLASRMVVKGTTATTFSPDREITRGEFAAILSRGLGLIPKSSTVKFTDVSSAQAFNLNGEIAAVVEAGIVKGDAKGKFRPYDEISRDEAAIMISRALDFIGTDGVKLDTTKKITNFKDYRYIGNTARPHVQKVYQAGYINGYSNGTFGASQDTERGQMAKILYNFLQSVKFIN